MVITEGYLAIRLRTERGQANHNIGFDRLRPSHNILHMAILIVPVTFVYIKSMPHYLNCSSFIIYRISSSTLFFFKLNLTIEDHLPFHKNLEISLSISKEMSAGILNGIALTQ